MELHFDIASFLFGCVAGLVFASLLRLKALKELRLKLDKIGVDLGIEGFSETKSSDAPTQTIGLVSGNGNEINQAGRDINKTSNLYKTVQAAAAAAIAKDGTQAPSVFQINTRFSHYTQNPSFQAQLSNIQRSGDNNWFEKYCASYMSDAGFQSDLAQEVNRLQRAGWHVASVRPVDNLNQGLLFEITSVKPFDQ